MCCEWPLCIDFTALFQGVLRINQRSYEDAFVDDPVCDVHVLVQSCNSFRGGKCLCRTSKNVCVCVCVCALIQTGGGDYYVNGMWKRNRAFERDVVVLELLPPEKWLVR